MFVQWEEKKDDAEARRAQRSERLEHSPDPHPRPTRKIGVWGTREKPGATRQHRLKPMLPVGDVFYGDGVG